MWIQPLTYNQKCVHQQKPLCFRQFLSQLYLHIWESMPVINRYLDTLLSLGLCHPIKPKIPAVVSELVFQQHQDNWTDFGPGMCYDRRSPTMRQLAKVRVAVHDQKTRWNKVALRCHVDDLSSLAAHHGINHPFYFFFPSYLSSNCEQINLHLFSIVQTCKYKLKNS